MNKNNAGATNLLIKTLSEKNQKYLKEIFMGKRVIIQRKDEEVTVARKILKPKSRRLPSE